MGKTYRYLETLEVKDETSVVKIKERNVFIYLGIEEENCLNLNLPTTTIVAQPFNVIKWQLKFNPVA